MQLGNLELQMDMVDDMLVCQCLSCCSYICVSTGYVLLRSPKFHAALHTSAYLFVLVSTFLCMCLSVLVGWRRR